MQKSRSGLTRMAKLTFEDLSGSTPAMLWPEEFAKMDDLVKNDLIVFVKGTLDRRRDPPELIISRIIPLEQGRGRADPRRRRPAAQGASTRPSTSSGCSAPSGSGPGNLDLYLEIMGLEQVRRAIYKAGASLADPLRRPADRRPGECRGRRASSACSASAAPPRGSTRAPPRAESTVHRAPARSLVGVATGPDLEADDQTLDDLDD